MMEGPRHQHLHQEWQEPLEEPGDQLRAAMRRAATHRAMAVRGGALPRLSWTCAFPAAPTRASSAASSMACPLAWTTAQTWTRGRSSCGRRWCCAKRSLGAPGCRQSAPAAA